MILFPEPTGPGTITTRPIGSFSLHRSQKLRTRFAVLPESAPSALGTRHSFNGIADSQIAQISTLKLNDVTLDAKASTVTVGAGIRYGDLAVLLDAKGFALHNLASLPHISVGGACATATHGSGMGNGNLATAVKAVELGV
jgi:xylitol oxidase